MNDDKIQKLDISVELPYAILDMDGTLVDSMSYWSRLGREYLASKGITENVEEVLERIKPMTMSESASVFVQEFSLPEAPEVVEAEMNEIMNQHYCQDIPLKNGVLGYLTALHQSGVQMCVASATAEELVNNCLHRLGIREWFTFILSCETVGAGKSSPVIYHTAAEKFGAESEKIAVYEDALYAAKTAKKAGFYVVGVYDENEENDWEELKAVADTVIRFERQ